jgi:outer membrane protein insertion porin family/translocation and assembly module TamA
MWAPFVCAVQSDGPPSPLETPLQVRSIHFKGVQALPVSELKKILVTKHKRFAWLTKAPLDRKVFQEDLERIEKYYLSQGFYHAHVVSHRIESVGGNEVRIEIEVEEGPPMTVSEVNLMVEGEPSGPWHNELSSIIPLHPGNRFTTPIYQDIETAILLFFANWGYPKARVDLRARLDKKTNLAAVSVNIVHGPVCYFGHIELEGNESVGQNIILRELTFMAGERFNGAKIQESQQRLFNLDLFQVVDLNVQNLEGDETTLPVRILVKESKKQTVRVGAGYGTEDSFRGQVQWELRDFLGDGRRLQVNAKASSLVQFLETRLLQPYLFSPKSSLTVNGGVRHENQESFENQKYYLGPAINYKWSDRLTSYAGYSLEANRLLDVDLLAGNLGPANEENQDYYISSLVQGTTWEKVDSALDPKDGWRLIENLEVASAGFGSEVDFIKLTLEARGYMPIAKYGVLAGKLKMGGIQKLENTTQIPIFKLFFAGGTDSVRGYPYQLLGPLEEESGNPEGGMTLVEGSMEWRFPIRKPFDGVVFFDYGSVFKDSYEVLLDDLRYTAGCGFRYLTLVGPLRLDFGYQLNPPEHEQFSPYQVHFSIGQAF